MEAIPVQVWMACSEFKKIKQGGLQKIRVLEMEYIVNMVFLRYLEPWWQNFKVSEVVCRGEGCFFDLNLV